MTIVGQLNNNQKPLEGPWSAPCAKEARLAIHRLHTQNVAAVISNNMMEIAKVRDKGVGGYGMLLVS